MIKIGFSKHKGFAPLSRLIMWCEGVDFSHAYVRISSASLGRDLIYQATGSGVNFIGLSAFSEASQIVEEYTLDLDSDARVKLLQWCVDTAGKPYGRFQLIGLGIVRLAKLVGIKINNPFSNGHSAYVCCELVVAALESLGLPGPGDLDLVDLVATRSMVKSLAKSDQ